MAEAAREFDRGRYEQAEQLAVLVDDDSPEFARSRLIAADAANRQGDTARALEHLNRVPRENPAEYRHAITDRAAILLDLKRLSTAEAVLEELRELEPQHPLVNDGLGHVFSVSGRGWEALPLLLTDLHPSRIGPEGPRIEQLVLLADVERPFGGVDYLELCRKASPTDTLPLIGLAVIAIAESRLDEARSLLKLASAGPANQATRPALDRWLARLDAEQGRDRAFLDWADGVASSSFHPESWVVLGLWAQRHGDERAAVRCLWEAALLEPNLRTANYQLGQLLVSLGEPDQAAPFLDRARRQQQLVQLLEHVEIRIEARFSARDAEVWKGMVELTESMGRLPEAHAWARSALARNPDLRWARETVARLEPRLRSEPTLPQTLPEACPAHQLDLSSYPLPDLQRIRPGDPSPSPARVAGRVRFAEIAREAGIDFTYYHSPDLDSPGVRMFEYTGGGVAVLDYDLDGWPDLYFSQGCRWPPGDADSPEYRDRLYRNTGDGRFVDVTDEAGLGDGRFSQGAAVGDLDNDGWPDLYVANIGANRLYRNNGDGTFSDISDAAGIAIAAWTTSCLVADLDGDSHPDLYDVNYLAGRRVFEKICVTNGVAFACHPNEFAGQQDRLWRSTGSGSFRDITETSGVAVADGKGLGIVAADFDGSGRLGLFIANDAVANFFFVPTAGSGDALFTEEALRRGLALDHNGRPQACMGIAAGYADADGAIDLFITNFYNESNVLYRQRSPGHFLDATRQAGLREPSWSMLGFGTQFLDADLDGDPDLVLANGHIDDFSRLGQPYHMRPQYFRNAGGGRFVEMTDAGPYFERELLGRGMARLDVDRDGREDLAVSHLESPVALLVNRTVDAGRSLSVRLVATTTARDAIGTIVSLRVGDWRRTAQLTAGDGYLASNQRQLVFGLGDRDRVEELTVKWPSGARASYLDVAADVELVIIEGASTPIPLPGRREVELQIKN